jgi:ribonuclease HII
VIAVSPQEIDRLNILEATRLAMGRAVMALDPAPDLVLVDAVPLPEMGFPVLPVIRGDLISYAIACASILAKVARDATMTALAAAEPAYGFAENKGYGSAFHRAALASHGPGHHHRRSFRLRSSRTNEVRG